MKTFAYAAYLLIFLLMVATSFAFGIASGHSAGLEKLFWLLSFFVQAILCTYIMWSEIFYGKLSEFLKLIVGGEK